MRKMGGIRTVCMAIVIGLSALLIGCDEEEITTVIQQLPEERGETTSSWLTEEVELQDLEREQLQRTRYERTSIVQVKDTFYYWGRGEDDTYLKLYKLDAQTGVAELLFEPVMDYIETEASHQVQVFYNVSPQGLFYRLQPVALEMVETATLEMYDARYYRIDLETDAVYELEGRKIGDKAYTIAQLRTIQDTHQQAVDSVVDLFDYTLLSVRDAIQVGEWYYYVLVGEQQGIFRCQLDGTSNQYIRSLESMPAYTLSGATITSIYEEDTLYYVVLPQGEAVSQEGIREVFEPVIYTLNQETQELTLLVDFIVFEYAEEYVLSVADLCVEGHVLGNTQPLFFYDRDTLLNTDEVYTRTIVEDASRGAWSYYAFEDITYIFSQENPFVMLLTTDRYALPTGIRVGDSLERLQTLYPSMRRIEEANDLYVSLDSVDFYLNIVYH